MELRDYQAAAIKGIFAAWENCRSALAVLPTGCGKTIVFASVIRRLLAGGISKTEGSRRVLVLAHREELIMQAKEKIVAVVPNAQIGIEMGEFKAHDFVGNSGRHKLITSADILGGKYPDEVVERARRKAARKTVNMSDALEEARLEYEEIERRKNADAARRKAIRAIAPFCLTKVNPFDAYDLPPVPVRSGEPPRRYSPNQARFLREYFQIDPERLPYVQGKQLLDEYGRRKNAGLASLKQVRLLRRKGVPVPMRFDEARRVLDRLVG